MSDTNSHRPYVGLIPFHEKDAEFFFGREQEREIITSNLIASRLTLLYGASGVGKSSVLNAGVAHYLRELAQRDIKRRGKPKFTVVVFNSWRDEPVSNLLTHVQKAVVKTLSGQRIEPVSSKLSFADSLLEWSRRVQGQLLIILDQFEEYFLYHPNEDGQGTFAVEFPRAVNTPGLPVNFILSYREDAHAKLDFFEGRIPNLYENYLRIGHLSYDAAYAAIKKPIERYNQIYKLGDGHRYAVEEELTITVLKQVRAGEEYIGDVGKGVIVDHQENERASWEVETPYLQLVMTRLWDTEVTNGSRILRLETLNKLGNAGHIVQTHLDNAMAAFSSKQQSMAANIFNYLVTRSGTKIAQTTHDLAGYADLTHEKEKQLEEMMENLSRGDHRILRSVPPPANQPDAKRYEVFHDVLAKAILDWRRRFLGRKARLRLLRVVGVMALFLLFMGGATAVAFNQRQAARNAERIARIAEGEALKQKQIADHNALRADDNAKRAETAAKQAEIAAEQNKNLAISNKELANKFQAAYRSEQLANVEAKEQRDRAEEAAQLAQSQQLKAEAAATEALKQKKLADIERNKAEVAAKEAEEQRQIVEDIDASNAYYKAVMRTRSDVSEASFSKDNKRVVTVSDDGVARVWDVNSSRKPTHELILDGGQSIRTASLSPDGMLLVTTSINTTKRIVGPIIIWDLTEAKPIQLDSLRLKSGELPEDPEPLTRDARFSRDGNSVIAYGLRIAKICRWNRSTRKLDKECNRLNIDDYVPFVADIQLSPDGNSFIVLNDTDDSYFLDLKGHKTILNEAEGGSESLGGRFSADGKYFATFNVDNVTRIFRTGTGQLVASLKLEDFTANGAFSPDGQRFVTASNNGIARVWDLSTGQLLATHSGHTAALTAAAFSPDGNYVVTASGDKTARVWEAIDGRLFAELRGHIGSVNSATFSTDGNFVLTSGDKTARIWDVTRRTGGVIASGDANIADNETFDLDAGQKNPIQILGVSSADFSLRYQSQPQSIHAFLSPLNKAQIAIFKPDTIVGIRQRFEDISVTELLGLDYSSTSLIDSDGDVNEPVGFIFAVRTSEGNFAKIQVLEKTRRALKIRWVTYANPTPSRASIDSRLQPAIAKEFTTAEQSFGDTFYNLFKIDLRPLPSWRRGYLMKRVLGKELSGK